MGRIMFIIVMVLFLMKVSIIHAEDNKPYRAYEGQIACLSLSDIELIGMLAQQRDTVAFEKMLKNGRCLAFKGVEVIYKLKKVDIYTQVRMKGGTIRLWTIMK